MVSLDSGSGEVVGYRGCRNDPSGSVKRGEFLDHLKKY